MNYLLFPFDRIAQADLETTVLGDDLPWSNAFSRIDALPRPSDARFLDEQFWKHHIGRYQFPVGLAVNQRFALNDKALPGMTPIKPVLCLGHSMQATACVGSRVERVWTIDSDTTSSRVTKIKTF